MVTQTAAEVSNEVVGAQKRDRRVERTVDLKEPQITAIEAAEMSPPAEPRHSPPETQADT